MAGVASSKDGGSAPAPTNQPTASSAAFSDYQKAVTGRYIRDTSLVPRTQQTVPPGGATLHPISSSTTSSYLTKFDPSSSTSNPVCLVKEAAVNRLVRAWDAINTSTGADPRAVKRQKPLETRPRHLDIPPTLAPPHKKPAPYPQTLTPLPSVLRPHCLARDRLRLWTPAGNHSPAPGASTLSTAERERVKDTMVHAWEQDTREAYGSGLLMWHCFCDDRRIPEPKRAPAEQSLLSAFVAHMAAAYSGKTISNYLNGVRAWHILHSVPWVLDKKEMDAMLRAAHKLTPNASKRKKRRPYTPDFIAAIRQHLDLDEPIDAAVFACLATCFYASARLGEFTVRTLDSFRPSAHVTTQNLSYDQDRNGLKVTVLHLPSTKAAGSEGEDVYWAEQEGETDPTAALQNHLRINQPSEASHLFAYRAKNTRRPLTKAKFLERVEKAARAASLEPLQGHGIRIGSTLEYLLRGVPFDVMKAKGRWAGDSFLLYLRKHAVVIAPYIQAAPILHEAFIRYTMPPVR